MDATKDLDTTTPSELPAKPTQCSVCQAEDGMKWCPCWKAAYCSTEHQKQDRSNHEPDCYPALILRSAELGKYLVATRDIKPGQIILKEVPLLVGPTSSFADYFPICLSCCSAVNDGYKCSKCQWTVCNMECEQAANHSLNECPIFQERQIPQNGSSEGYNYVQMLRALLLKDKCPEKWETLLGFVSHVEERKKRSAYVDAVQKDRDFIHEKCQLHQFDFDTVNYVSGILAFNSFEPRCVSHQYAVPKGLSFESRLYEFASKLIHNCVSNVKVIIDYKNKKRVPQEIALAAISPISRGGKLSQFYGNSEIGTYERQKNQIDNYFFSCKCERCLDPTELGTWVSGIKCRAENCPSGYLLPRNPLDLESLWECGTCGVTQTYKPFISDRVEEVNTEVSTLMGHVAGLEDDIKDFDIGSRVVAKIESVLKKYSGIMVHPNHYALLPLKFSLLHALFNTNNPNLPNETRLKLCGKTDDLIKEYLPVYDALFPGLTPERGKILFYHAVSSLNQLNLSISDSTPVKASCNELIQIFKTAQELLYGSPEQSEEKLMYEQLGLTERLVLSEMAEAMILVPLYMTRDPRYPTDYFLNSGQELKPNTQSTSKPTDKRTMIIAEAVTSMKLFQNIFGPSQPPNPNSFQSSPNYAPVDFLNKLRHSTNFTAKAESTFFQFGEKCGQRDWIRAFLYWSKYSLR